MVDQCLLLSNTLKALTTSSNHLRTQTIWKRLVSKGRFEEYELRDIMKILIQNC